MRDGVMVGVAVSDDFTSGVGRRLVLEREIMAVLWGVGSGLSGPL